MGDYLRYAMFDKYFKKIGNCVGAVACPAGTGKDSAHYLLSWYYAWGGATTPAPAGRGASAPATTTSATRTRSRPGRCPTTPALDAASRRPRRPTGRPASSRQLEFYTWLQSAEGGIAGGATNSWDGSYAHAAGRHADLLRHVLRRRARSTTTRRRNQWFGMQAWSMERVAELLLRRPATRKAKAVLDKWVPWALANTTLGTDGASRSRRTLAWTGQPDTWNPSSPAANTGLHVDGHRATARTSASPPPTPGP